jgi:hypothetical protein
MMIGGCSIISKERTNRKGRNVGCGFLIFMKDLRFQLFKKKKLRMVLVLVSVSPKKIKKCEPWVQFWVTGSETNG